MERFFCDSLSPRTLLSSEESHHCLKVKRMKPQEEAILFDGKGNYALARLLSTQPGKQALFELIEQFSSPLPPYRIHLAVAPPKGERWKLLLQKVTEVGIHQILPLQCERSVVFKDERKSSWDQVIIDAAKQSQRNDLPEILPPCSFSAFLKTPFPSGTTLLLASSTPSAPLLRELRPRLCASVWLLIGPEGGFSAKELALAEEAGVLCFHEPGTILRIETAAIAFSAILKHLLLP